MKHAIHVTAAAMLLAGSTGALAQMMRPFPVFPPAKPSGADQTTPTPPADPPTLDDLLGIAPDKAPPKDKPPAADTTRAELDRMLSAKEAADQFKLAVDLMGQTAERLQASRDTGLATQRLQEDILRKLDMVINSAQQQQQQNQSRSRQQSQQDPSQQNQPNQQQQPGQRDQASSNPAQDTIDPPTRREGPLSADLAARGARWGALPERVREALLQGNADKYSSLYPKQTEAYYKRLAEEGSR